jgi:hypothetical protein
MLEVTVGTVRPRARTRAILAIGLTVAIVPAAWGQQALGSRMVKGRPITEFLSAGGLAAALGKHVGSVPPGSDAIDLTGPASPTASTNGFVNDPCLDPGPLVPFPFNFFDVVQSETELAVWNGAPGGREFKPIVAGYNDSKGFTTNTQGLSGFAYNLRSGQKDKWIDGGGLPPRFPDTGPPPPGGLAFDQFFGDPSLVVNQRTGEFFYGSIYVSPQGYSTISVSRGVFKNAKPQGAESVSNTRCEGRSDLFGVPLNPPAGNQRIIWDKPVEAVRPPFLGPDNADFPDKPFLAIDQKTGTLYVTYTRFAADGPTPLEVVVSFDGGHTWTPPRTIVPNLNDTLNQAAMAVVTPTGRVIATWWSRVFDLNDPTFPIKRAQIQAAYSDNQGLTWSDVIRVAAAEPQGEPPGYNRERPLILNAPFIAVDRGKDDGNDTAAEKKRAGFGNVYIVYTRGTTPLPAIAFDKAADIFVVRSTNDGRSWGQPVRINDDGTQTIHVFPNVQVNKDGKVFVSWIDRRRDPVNNIFNDTFAAASTDLGQTFGPNLRVTDVPGTSWFTRADAAPNFGDYNSSDLIDYDEFAVIWADGRFLPPGRTKVLHRGTKATPDALFTRTPGL